MRPELVHSVYRVDNFLGFLFGKGHQLFVKIFAARKRGNVALQLLQLKGNRKQKDDIEENDGRIGYNRQRRRNQPQRHQHDKHQRRGQGQKQDAVDKLGVLFDVKNLIAVSEHGMRFHKLQKKIDVSRKYTIIHTNAKRFK